MEKEYLCKWCGRVWEDERLFCGADCEKKCNAYTANENKKLLNKQNEKAKRQALKVSGLKKVVVFVREEEVEPVKKFDRSREIWLKSPGRKKRKV